MRGIILGGGLGTRLYPLTKARNKHTIAIAGRAMIEYPIIQLLCEGIREIGICLNGPYGHQVEEIVGDGGRLGCNITYFHEDVVSGPGMSLFVAREWGACGHENIAVLFGDGIFFTPLGLQYTDAPRIFLMELHGGGADDPSKYAQARVEGNMVLELVEKPQTPISNLVQTGAFVFPNDVFGIIEAIAQKTPHGQEIGITEINTRYIEEERLSYSLIPNGTYIDCGTHNALREAEQRILQLQRLGSVYY